MLRRASCADAPAWFCVSHHCQFPSSHKSKGKGDSAYIANDMCVTEVDAECLSGINARIHTCQDKVFFCGRESQFALREG